jgi:hypothetical protein
MIQRAPRSLCRSLARLAHQFGSIRPSLIAFFSSERRRNQTGIDDLTRHGDVASPLSQGIEMLKQSLYRAGRGQLLPERFKLIA